MKMNITEIHGLNTTKSTYFISFDNNGWLVQDLYAEQNSTLFINGVSIIMNMKGKRGEFLQAFLNEMAHDFGNVATNPTVFTTQKYCSFIAFVCDIANQENMKKFPNVYHKDFPKYCSNLCWNYYLDEDFEAFKNGKQPTFDYYKSDTQDKENCATVREVRDAILPFGLARI